ncbi:uncharacterized protein LOC131313246 [Rhododendron vialii]|uniref:uncharacterized protein LOC131313246 n=1 Tax=Rhododendron vialii TaxID=182163 RepID=UPI00265F53B8|nr:uncharacterized protein LOC131313246 [Rhododendron vialii]
MRNHESHPAGSIPFLEANRVSFPNQGRGRGRGRGHGRGSHNHQVHGGYVHKSGKKPDIPLEWNKWTRPEVSARKGKNLENKPPRNSEDSCYRCGAKGHWSRTCRTPRHLANLYQASIKGKEKEIETNFIDQMHNNQPDLFEPFDISSFDISEYIGEPSGTKNDLYDENDYPEWSQQLD